MIDNDEIKPIPSWPNYYASRAGLIYTDRTGALVKVQACNGPDNIPQVNVRREGERVPPAAGSEPSTRQ